MKARVLRFFGIVVALLLVMPIVNLWLAATSADKPGEKVADLLFDDRRALYHMDAPLAWLAPRAYALGISVEPTQVIIGRQNWLFLGDHYQQTLSRKRQPASAEDRSTLGLIQQTSQAWNVWLADHGVLQYRVQLVPDKSSLYTEFLPRWARPVAGHASGQLRELASDALYSNQLPALRAARQLLKQPLYYRTDTHWNALGGWVGYQALARDFTAHAASPEAAALRWLAPEQVRVGDAAPRSGGDLASFLGLEWTLEDLEIPVELDIGRPLPTEQIDFETGERTQFSDNPRLGPPWRPLLVHSPNALNQARLFWLRDSFGAAMSPLMAATFSDVLQLDYAVADAAKTADLVRAFRPDYVIVTVVERLSLSDWFQEMPPAETVSCDGSESDHCKRGEQ